MDANEIYKSLGRAVAARRSKIGKTQQEIADDIGMSRASIANIECGRQKVMLHQAYALVNALELKSIFELIPATPPQSNSEFEVATNRDDLSSIQRAGIDSLVASALNVKAKSQRSF